jgi:hypothetical protein
MVWILSDNRVNFISNSNFAKRANPQKSPRQLHTNHNNGNSQTTARTLAANETWQATMPMHGTDSNTTSFHRRRDSNGCSFGKASLRTAPRCTSHIRVGELGDWESMHHSRR